MTKRFPRTAREAFQGRGNPPLAPRHSSFFGEFEKPHWILRLLSFLKGVFNG